jgi:predicted nucleic acid-binding OB-fold protein
MGFVEVETGSCSETCVTCDVDGTEEVSIKVEESIDIKEEVSIKLEESIDIKDEISKAVTYSPVKTEHEVRLQGVCEVVVAHAFRPFIAPKKNL